MLHFLTVDALLIIILPLVIIIVAFFRSKPVSLELSLVALLSVGLGVLLKNIFKVGITPDPQGMQLSQYDFPSLSVLLTVALWGQVYIRSRRLLLFLLGILMVIGISYYKISTAQHSLPDVIGATAIGIMLLLVYNYGQTIRSK